MSGPLSPIAPFTAAARLAATLAAACLAAVALPAQANDVSYPPSRALSDIAAWLQRDTPLRPDQIVDISPQAVTAVTSASPVSQMHGFLANIASEAMDPAMLAHDGLASWTIPVQVDCDRRSVRLGAMTGYRSRDLATEPRVVREADATWVSPTPNAPLGAVIRALCDREFHRPLTGKAKATGPRKAEPKPGPPPIVEVRPKRVAEAAPKAGSATETDKPADGATAPAATLKAPLTVPMPGAASSPPNPAKATEREAKAEAAKSEAAKSEAAKSGPKFKPPAGGGEHAVQIGASPSLADIQGLVTRFKKKFGADLGGLKMDVITVQVEGKTVNRALVSGFASTGEAGGFCRMLANGGQACFVRH